MLNPSTKPEEIYNRRTPKSSSRQVFDWFLVGLACLLPLDVAVRRVQIDPRVIVSWFRPAQAASTQTMGALLQRKQAVDSRLDAHRGEAPAIPSTRTSEVPQHLATSTPARSTSTSHPRATQPKRPTIETTAEDAMSTTERLLALKRRRGDDDEPGDSN